MVMVNLKSNVGQNEVRERRHPYRMGEITILIECTGRFFKTATLHKQHYCKCEENIKGPIGTTPSANDKITQQLKGNIQIYNNSQASM
jgi:hypothetical protein